MAIIVNGDGILTGVSSLATALTDLTSGRGTVTGVATVGTLQLGAGVSMGSPRSQNAAIFTNNTEFLTVDDAGRVGVGTISPNTDAHPQNVGKINVGFITARSVAGDIDGNTLVVAGISTFVGNVNLGGGNIVLGDSGGASDDRLTFGAGTDFSLYHTGSHSFIEHSGTGHLILGGVPNGNNVDIMKAGYSEYMARFKPDSSVDLYYDANVRFQTTPSGADVTGTLNVTGISTFGGNLGVTGEVRPTSHLVMNSADNQIIYLGASNDLQLVHNGSDSLITDSGTGSLALGGSAVFIQNAAHNANMASFVAGAEANLFHSGTKRLETTTSGAKVTGTTFLLQDSGSVNLVVGSTNAGGAYLVLDGDSDGNASGGDYTYFEHNTSGNLNIIQNNPAANGKIDFFTGGAGRFSMQSDKFRASNDNACTLGTDGLAWANVFTKGNYVAKGASGTGVDFAHSASAGTASNILDDYEEGSWTPGVYPESSAMTISYDLRTGSYVKIGRVVYWHFRLRLSGFSGNSNQTIGISGLPATVDSSQPQFSAGIYGYNFAGQAPIGVFYHGGTTRGRMYYYSGTPSWSDSYASDFQNNTYLAGSGFYFIA